MESPDLTLSPGDILRTRVDHIDASLDACFLDAGPYGMLFVPLAGISATTVADLVPGASVCAQVVAPKRAAKLPRASVNIEFSGRTSVLVLDGCAIMATSSPARPEVFVSKKLAGVRRAELADKLQAAVADPSTGLPSMLEAVCGPVTLILRTTADELPWETVLSGVVVQVTEAAAFTVLARISSAPALLMAEKPDADGDSTIGTTTHSAYNNTEDALDGRRIDLACGAQIVFERTEAMWTVAVKRTQADVAVATVDAEAAQAVIEALLEFDVRGIVAVALLEGLPLDAFNDLIDDMSDGLSDGKTRISGDASLSVALIERGRRTI